MFSFVAAGTRQLHCTNEKSLTFGIAARQPADAEATSC